MSTKKKEMIKNRHASIITMALIPDAYNRLFPNTPLLYETRLEYNRRLSPFNANIKLHRNTLSIHLNLQWKDIDDEIKIGLIQNLLLKILKKKAHTPNIDLYSNFVKNIPTFTAKTKTDTLLEASFHRLNAQFFENQMQQPNLQWGTSSFRKLASYNFHDDTVTVSTLFQHTQQYILDYLMYHELLHKYHQFSHKNGRSSYHSTAFRHDEHKFPDHRKIEQEITHIIRKRPRKGIFSFIRNI